jgi:hypothetical protein
VFAPSGRLASAAGGAVATTATGRFPAKKCHVPPAITMSATIPAIIGKSAERDFGFGGLGHSLAWAGCPLAANRPD